MGATNPPWKNTPIQKACRNFACQVVRLQAPETLKWTREQFENHVDCLSACPCCSLMTNWQRAWNPVWCQTGEASANRSTQLSSYRTKIEIRVWRHTHTHVQMNNAHVIADGHVQGCVCKQVVDNLHMFQRSQVAPGARYLALKDKIVTAFLVQVGATGYHCAGVGLQTNNWTWNI